MISSELASIYLYFARFHLFAFQHSAHYEETSMTGVKADGLYLFLRQTYLHDRDLEEEKQVYFASLLHQEGQFMYGGCIHA